MCFFKKKAFNEEEKGDWGAHRQWEQAERGNPVLTPLQKPWTRGWGQGEAPAVKFQREIKT